MSKMLLRRLVGLVLSVAAARGQVPEARLAKLSQGVNVPHWFWYAKDPSVAGVRAYLTEGDAGRIRRSGLTHVRLPIEPGPLWDLESRSLKSGPLAELRRAIDLLIAADLAVIVDIHPNQTPWAAIEGKEPKTEEFEKFVVGLAGAIKGTNPDSVLIEVLNEPHNLPDHAVWPRLQVRLVGLAREVLPRHTIIVTGDDWGGIDGLKRLAPLADKNLVYSFHFYEPMNFTHQGATWGWPPWKHMKGVPYPSSPENVKVVADGIQDKQAHDAVIQYGKEHWDAEKIRARIAEAAAWGKEHHVPVYCGEFGAFREKAPAADRLRWLRDTTAALRGFGIGWARWDYAGGFALFAGNAGARDIDPEDAKAMELSR